MFMFIPGSIPPVRFGPGEADPPDESISPVTYILCCYFVVIIFGFFVCLFISVFFVVLKKDNDLSLTHEITIA